MDESYIFKTILTEDDIMDVNLINLDDINFTLSIYKVVFLGGKNELLHVKINDESIKLPGGFVYDFNPITKIEVVDSNDGVLVLGSKRKKKIFSQHINDLTLNNVVISGYIIGYYQ
jgi:hypothetical protein